MEGYRFSMSATRNAVLGGNFVLCSRSMIAVEFVMYEGIFLRYGCSFMSSRVDAGWVGVLMVEHMGRSWIGGYGLCSLGLKYSLANDGLSLFSSCSRMFAIVE